MSLDTTLGQNTYGEQDTTLEFLTYLKERYKCSPIPYQIHAKGGKDIETFMLDWKNSVS